MTKEEFLRKFREYINDALEVKPLTSFGWNFLLIILFHMGLLLVLNVAINNYFCELRWGERCLPKVKGMR